MNTTTKPSLLIQPQISLETMLKQVQALAQDDWIQAIMYGRASSDRKKLMRSIDDQLGRVSYMRSQVRIAAIMAPAR